MAETSGSEEHPLYNRYPTRLPVWWARSGTPGVHPEEDGVSGRRITLRFPKTFNRLEKVMMALFGGSREIRRPLDDMNSLLWELCDGTRSFNRICSLMDSTFHEKVAPVMDRTAVGLAQLERLGCIAMLDSPFDGGWPTGPGVVPPGQDMEQELEGFDTIPLPGEVSLWEEE